jgi:hypothetical protein
MPLTLVGNYIQLASHFLVLFGFRELSQEESNAIAITVGLVGEIVGFVMTHIGRVRLNTKSAGTVNMLGFRTSRY